MGDRVQMSFSCSSFPVWLSAWMQAQKIDLWGAADLRKFSTPKDDIGQGFPFALTYALPMAPQIMLGIQCGPNQAYADEYVRVNNRINKLAGTLAAELRDRGYRACALAASERTDLINLAGDFPHKTAATQAGLGWIGRHCQLVTWKFGPWVRLGTVFTDIELPGGPPDAAQLLWPVPPLRGGVPGWGLERPCLVSRTSPGRHPGCICM
jgi:epoxyqueuosine reductase